MKFLMIGFLEYSLLFGRNRIKDLTNIPLGSLVMDQSVFFFYFLLGMGRFLLDFRYFLIFRQFLLKNIFN